MKMKKNYLAPEVEITQVVVEAGIAMSTQNTQTNDFDNEDWE